LRGEERRFKRKRKMAEESRNSEKVKKLHRNLAEAVFTLVSEVIEQGGVAERALERRLQSEKKWGGRDRRLVAESFFEMVRWWRKWASHAGIEGDVVGDQWWPVLGAYWQAQGYARPDWALWPEQEMKNNDANRSRAIRESIPDALDEYGQQVVGARWESVLSALNQPAEIYLRRRLGAGSEDDFLAAAAVENIVLERVEMPGVTAWRVADRRAVSPRWLAQGWAEIQDLGSQVIGHFCDLEPGQSVIDACAGAGGKTLQLADLMEDRGQILALDVVLKKLETLQHRAKRARATMVQAELWSEALTALLAKKVDRVLVDAPCSGSGTWRRQPDLKWRTTVESVHECVAKQREILEKAAEWVRPGGKLIYATCSIFPAENAEQVEWFTQRHADYELEASRQLWPGEQDTDGFFMARWRRK
jgi:16S rRNA (cytosine967-C5)-methyltransferase